MSGPSSPMHGGWSSWREEPKPEPYVVPKPQPPLRRRTTTKKPKRNPYKTRWKDLTPEEMASFRLYPKED